MASSEGKDKSQEVTDEDLQELAGELTKEWIDLARKLKIHESTIQATKRESRDNQREAIYQMLLSWKQGEAEHATYEVLAEALRKVKRRDLSNKLQKAGCTVSVQMPTTTPSKPPPAEDINKPGSHFPKLRQRKEEKAEKIFISFSFTMKDRVTELKHLIEEDIGKDTCWICTTGIRGGDNLDGKIAKAIHNAEIVLCMISKAYVDSADCEKEFLLARKLKKHIIPIHLEPVDLIKSDGQVSPLQLGLARALYVNLYNEDMMEEEFRKLIEQIKLQLQMQE